MLTLLSLMALSTGCGESLSDSIERQIREREVQLHIEREAANRLNHRGNGPITFDHIQVR